MARFTDHTDSLTTILPGNAASGTVAKGHRLRIVDVAGQQVCDMALFMRDDPAEHCDVIYSCFAVERWRLGVGDILYSKRMRSMATIVADSCGVHEWTGGCCSHDLNRFLGRDAPGCKEAIETEMRRLGLSSGLLDSTSCLNVFMNTPHQSPGGWPTLLPVSKPGDFLELQAEVPLLWVATVCTMPPPVNGLPLSPIRVETFAESAVGELP
jgi:hypothetical protein